jgi:hypothetical protein
MTLDGTTNVTALVVTNAALGIVVGAALIALVAEMIRDGYRHRKARRDGTTYGLVELRPSDKPAAARSRFAAMGVRH